MSILITGDHDLIAYSSTVPQQVYLSTLYTLTGVSVFIEYQNPLYLSVYQPEITITEYVTDFGDGSPFAITSPDQTVFHKYNQKGTYYISYTAIYGDPQQTHYNYTVQIPFTVESSWNEYNQEQLRLNNEITLNLPYTLEQINIQPNEWGAEDIFNTSILRLQECLNYLNGNIQTINTQSPTVYYGWLGNNAGSSASGIKWFTATYNSQNYKVPELGTNTGTTYFSNVIDAVETHDHLYVLDGTKFRAFSSGAIPIERNFYNSANISDLLIRPLSFDIDPTGYFVYICDSPTNKIYKFNLDLSNNPAINLQLSIGGFGGALDHNRFNSPTEIIYNNDNVYVLDYNNYCIKQFNVDLNWIHTYNPDIFETDKPISFAVHPKLSLIYAITNSYKIYIIDNLTNTIFETIDITQIKDNVSKLSKILFDENGDFFYILTDLYIFKYATSGNFITQLDLPKTSSATFTYNNIKRGPNKSFIVSTPHTLQKFQDVLQIFKLGDGLSSNYWTDNQLKVTTDEFSSDLNYNRSLNRIAQNIKTFRDNLNAKFVLANEQTKYGIITYFSWIPIDVETDLPSIDLNVENETLGVGVNELHVPSVFNRELEKLYNSIDSIKGFLEIKNYVVNNNNCADQFCWSWSAMASYNLTLPVIRTCNVNPITYFELTADFPANYAPTKTWADAKSKCCS